MYSRPPRVIIHQHRRDLFLLACSCCLLAHKLRSLLEHPRYDSMEWKCRRESNPAHWLMPAQACRESGHIHAIVLIAYWATVVMARSRSGKVCVKDASSLFLEAQYRTWQRTGAMALGGRTDLRMAEPVPATARALRKAGGHSRGILVLGLPL